MPSQRHHEPGDLYVKLYVKFPDSLDPASIPLLERVLAPRKALDTYPPGIILEDVELDSPDQRQRDRASEDAMDEDEGGEPRVQCANQ
jgi:DnaJ homolog subfamily A member 2